MRTTPTALSEEDGTKDNELSYMYLILPGGAASLEGRKSSSCRPVFSVDNVGSYLYGSACCCC